MRRYFCGAQGLAVGQGAYTAGPVGQAILLQVVQILVGPLKMRAQMMQRGRGQQAFQMAFGQLQRQGNGGVHGRKVERRILGEAPAVRAFTLVADQLQRFRQLEQVAL
ncbi:hypothetical protein D3C77_670900 [compost metagenome]